MRGSALWIGLFAADAAADRPLATDLPLNPAAAPLPAQRAPAQHRTPTPPAAPNAACLEWTDGCRVCQRAPDGEPSCSNVGIACVPKAEECTRR